MENTTPFVPEANPANGQTWLSSDNGENSYFSIPSFTSVLSPQDQCAVTRPAEGHATIKLVVYGLTGSGKSTSSAMVRTYFENQGHRVEVLKLAQPLYELQQQFYRVAQKSIDLYAQDQVLLEIIAAQLRRISPTSLIDDFMRRLAVTTADVVINDDLRDTQVDYPALRQHGFRFIRITCREQQRLERLQQRSDLSIVTHSATTTQIDAIKPDIVVDNSGSLADLQQSIYAALGKLVCSG